MNKHIAAPAAERSFEKVWAIVAHDDVGPDHRAGEPAAPPRHGLTAELAHRIVKRGISSRAIGALSAYLGVGKNSVAEYLDLDRGTANRWAARNQRLPTHSADGVMRLLELDRMAADTFESEAESARWLRRPHPMLDGETPLAAAKTSFGAQQVKDILVAVKYGGVV